MVSWYILFSDEFDCVGGFFILLPTPFANRPNSFADDWFKLSLFFGVLRVAGSSRVCQNLRLLLPSRVLLVFLILQ